MSNNENAPSKLERAVTVAEQTVADLQSKRAVAAARVEEIAIASARNSALRFTPTATRTPAPSWKSSMRRTPPWPAKSNLSMARWSRPTTAWVKRGARWPVTFAAPRSPSARS